METLWCVRARGSEVDPVEVYGDLENIFSLRIHHGGVLIQHPVRKYVDGKVDYVDMIDAEKFSILELDYMIQEIGYPKDQILCYHFLIPEMEFSTGLRALGNDQDTLLMLDYVPMFKIIELFVEQYSLKPLALEWVNQESVDNHDVVDSSFDDMNGNEAEQEDIDDPIEDKKNRIDDYDINMESFEGNIGENNELLQIEGIESDENVDGDDIAIDLDDFEECSGDELDNLLDSAVRKYRKRKKKTSSIEDDPFFVGQIFSNKDDIKSLVKTHVVKSRRQLHIKRNEKYRFRVVCLGINPVFISGENGTAGGCQSEPQKSSLGDSESKKYKHISDRQKGIIPALKNVFPTAEHRFCLRHIHENMKSKWRGNVFKDMLWKAASATTIPQFEKHMDAIKEQDLGLHKWLMEIPPKHWARAHFSGRPKCDVLLNNLCEVFNKQLVGGRDKPIISCLEYIREYMMRRISVVNKLINKSHGPLTPTATKIFNQIKEKASQYVVQFNGQHKYQVSGPWNDQFVVDMETKTCSCRKWELTGIPCKHAVAVNWDMIRNGFKVGLPESWVSEVYWLDTWKKVYQHTVDPINCRDMWKPSSCPTSLLPPKHHVQVGRPKKARRKSAEELSQRIEQDGKMTRLGGTVTCGNCKNKGHNKRNCKGQRGDKESGKQTKE